MSSTDTNQASQDELKEQINDVFARACKNNEYFGYDGWYELHTPTMRVEIKELIRTEKLKLLAEVRERVIGENDYQPGNQAPVFVERNRLARDGLRDEQRAELDKLEAEL